MNPGPTAKQIAAEAIASGALRVGGEYAELRTHSFLPPSLLKTPHEANIAPIRPAPKADGRTKAVRRNKPHPSGNKKYIITKAQLMAERPHLYL